MIYKLTDAALSLSKLLHELGAKQEITLNLPAETIEKISESINHEAHYYNFNGDALDSALTGMRSFKFGPITMHLVPDDHLEKYLSQARDIVNIANSMGFKPGVWIKSHAFPNKPLKIGYGFVYSRYQKAIVVGCTDGQESYYSAVPIWYPNKDATAEILKNQYE